MAALKRGVVRKLRWAIPLLAMAGVVGFGRFAWTRPTASAKPLPIYTVNTTEDNQTSGDGKCTLREALILVDVTFNYSNDCGSYVATQPTIEFNIGSGTPTIAVDHAQGPLPVITRSVVINGNTGGADRVEISGTGVSGSGLFFSGANASGSIVYRLVINGFLGGAGIRIQDVANFTVKGSFIGTNASGTLAIQNEWGISAFPAYNMKIGGSSGTTPGGPCTGDCNLISGNSLNGVQLAAQQPDGLAPLVQGNFIGTDISGTLALGNGEGVFIFQESGLIGGSYSGEGNLISGNQVGIELSSTNGVLIRRNLIGTKADGTSPLGNSGHGIYAWNGPAATSIGGEGFANTIAYNGDIGVELFQTTIGLISRNSIFSNLGGGILVHDENRPSITGANPLTGKATCAGCTIEIFSDVDGQGRYFEGTAVADSNGDWTYSGALTGPDVTAAQTYTDAYGDHTSLFSGAFVLPATPTPSPTVTSSGSPTPTPTLTTTPTQTPTSTPTHTASPTPTHTPTVERVEGDLDCDGHINLVDFDLLLAFVGQLDNGLTPGACPDLYELFQGRRWGDFNCDGFLTARDSLYLLEYVAEATGLPHPAPPCPEIGTQLA